MNEIVTSKKIKSYQPKEFKIVAIRECPTSEELQNCDTGEKAAQYWNSHVKQHPYFNPEVECAVVLILNTRNKIKGHQLISVGIADSCLIHPREVFRLAIHASASKIVLMHNHPSGDSTPSEADIKITRDLKRAGELLKIELLDHVIVGSKHTSLRELGFFY